MCLVLSVYMLSDGERGPLKFFGNELFCIDGTSAVPSQLLDLPLGKGVKKRGIRRALGKIETQGGAWSILH